MRSSAVRSSRRSSRLVTLQDSLVVVRVVVVVVVVVVGFLFTLQASKGKRNGTDGGRLGAASTRASG